MTIVGGNRVTQWNDKSGNLYKLTTTNSSTAPTIVTTINNPIGYDIYFNAAVPGAPFLRNSSFSINVPSLTVFIVYWIAQSQTYFGRIATAGTTSDYNATDLSGFTFYTASGNSPTNYIYAKSTNIQGEVTSGTSRQAYHIAALPMTTSPTVSLTSFMDGATTNVINSTNSTYTFNFTQFSIGASIQGSNAFNGNINEVILYTTQLSAQDRQRVEGYLSWKWGLQRSTIPIAHPFYRFPSATTTPFSPGFLTGLSTWYDATALTGANGSAVTTWNDKSSIGNNLSGGTSPTLVTSGLNGLNVVRFASNSSQYLVMSNPNSLPLGTSSASYFAITRTSNSTATQQVFMYGSTPNTSGQNVDFGFLSNNATSDIYTTGTILDGNANNNTFVLISNVMTGTSANVGWVNGTSFSTTNNASLSTKNIGATGTVAGFVGAGRLVSNIQYFLSGDIAEILIYSGALTGTQRQQVEGYLAWKWGLQTLLPTTHPYYRVQI